MTPPEKRPFDWRLVAIWAVVIAISWIARSYVMVFDESRGGNTMSVGRALAIEGASHLVVAALLPAVYWVHGRWPINGGPINLAAHAIALVPFSFAHTLGLAALRHLWFAGIHGEAYRFPITWERLTYEFTKDIITYAMLSGGIFAFRYVLQRRDASVPPAAPLVAPAAAPERFAVRKRGGSEVVVEVADIDWIEASGNYAILHVGGETFEIRSTLAKLESELDPRRFVRVHKSHVVNVTRVVEVVPWVSGDWRIRLRGGEEVNLSRRYRQRFEALMPIRT
jgi:hypothetical protein